MFNFNEEKKSFRKTKINNNMEKLYTNMLRQYLKTKEVIHNVLQFYF